jgi:hypothetical protein
MAFHRTTGHRILGLPRRGHGSRGQLVFLPLQVSQPARLVPSLLFPYLLLMLVDHYSMAS